MKTETREKIIKHKYKVYISEDGQEFESEEKCLDQEKRVSGSRITCPDCNGQGRWKTDYVEEHDHWEGRMGGYWNYKTCPKCGGKGYLDKKVSWE